MTNTLVSLHSVRKLIQNKLETQIKCLESSDGEFFAFVPKDVDVNELKFNPESLDNPLTCITSHGTNDSDEVVTILFKYEMIMYKGEYYLDLDGIRNGVLVINGDSVTSQDITFLLLAEESINSNKNVTVIKATIENNEFPLGEAKRQPSPPHEITFEHYINSGDWSIQLVGLQYYEFSTFSLLLECNHVDGDYGHVLINSGDLIDGKTHFKPLGTTNPYGYFSDYVSQKLRSGIYR